MRTEYLNRNIRKIHTQIVRVDRVFTLLAVILEQLVAFLPIKSKMKTVKPRAIFTCLKLEHFALIGDTHTKDRTASLV